MSLGENLQKLRKECGMTQSELADAVGVTQFAISMFERGTKLPSLAVTEMIADELGCSIDRLLGRENKEK